MKKKGVIRQFGRHVSSGKAAFFKRYRMPFVMGERSGPWIADVDGKKKLLNLHCNGGVFNLGHRPQFLIDELTAALGHLDIGNHHLMSAERARTAAALAATMPSGLDYVIFGSGGGEAVDTAIKVARGYTGRRQVVSFGGGYHGHTGLAVATGDAKYREPFQASLPGFVQVRPFDLEAVRAAVGPDTAAVIVETIPATLGMVIPPEGFYRELSQVCREAGALLIMDEVQTGLGRTGRMWGFEHYDVEPDIVVVGKGLSGGIYPISATVISGKMDRLFRDDPFVHISTFGGSELGCRVAARVIEHVRDAGFLTHVNSLAAEFANSLTLLQSRHSRFFRGVRQKGLMIGLEFDDPADGLLVSRAAYANDLLMVYANNDSRIVQMLPPLNLELSQVAEVERRLDRTFRLAARLKPVARVFGLGRSRSNPQKSDVSTGSSAPAGEQREVRDNPHER